MFKKVILSVVILIPTLFWLMPKESVTYPGTPPLNNTGAPGHNTCAGCHSSGGSISMDFANGATEYTPGQTYNMSVVITNNGKQRFGFSAVARNSGNGDVGSWIASGANTQVHGSSNYIGHDAALLGQSSPFTYNFDWTAPSTGTGDVTFYFAGIGGNGSGSSGDGGANGNLTISEMAPAVAAIKTKAFLQGNYAGSGMMQANLVAEGLLPSNQPFNAIPWNYSGTESVINPASNIVDWVLVELRNMNNNSVVVAAKAALLREDGIVVETDGTDMVTFSGVAQGDYFIVLRHRNHLDVISATSSTANSNPTLYDFSTASGQASGTGQLTNLGDGNFGLISGDISGDGTITVTDFNTYQLEASSIFGYFASDLNLDKIVSVHDYNIYNQNSSIIGVDAIKY